MIQELTFELGLLIGLFVGSLGVGVLTLILLDKNEQHDVQQPHDAWDSPTHAHSIDPARGGVAAPRNFFESDQ